MAQTGYSKVQIYSSSTATNTPSASNLTNDTSGSELAINITDGKLFYKDNSGTVQVLATKGGAFGTVTSVAATVPSFLSISGSPINSSGTLAITLSGTALPTTSGGTGLTSFTANGVVYASSTSALATGSAFQFDGSNLGVGVTPSAWGGSFAGKTIQVGTTGAFVATNGGSTNMFYNSYNNGTNYIYQINDYAQRFSVQGNLFVWQQAVSGTAGGTISYTNTMTLDASGRLLVGSTSPNGKLYVENSTETNTVKIWDTNGSTTSDGVLAVLASRNTTNNTFYAISYYNAGAGAYKFRVADSGNVTNTNNSYGAISDIKLKENIVDATPKLEDLCKVKIRQYNLKSDPDHKQIGVVAQELEEVFAGLVETITDKDIDGNDLGTTTKQVKYSVFVPMLIKAIQEQQAMITTLQTQVTALKG